MTVKVLILEDNPVARAFLCRVVRESFSDVIAITEAGDLEGARKQVALAGGSVLFQPDASGVQFEYAQTRKSRKVQGLTRFAVKSAKTPIEKAFARVAGPALATLVALKDLVAGRPPSRR